MSGKYVHLNGSLVAAADATISVSDAGFLHGASSFTTMRAHNGVVFRLATHLSRLLGTVDVLGLRTEATSESLTAAVKELLAANKLSDARLRITLSPGDVLGGGPTVVITAEVLPEYPPAWYSEGISVSITELRQSPTDIACGRKTGCYFPRILAMRTAAAKDAQEALWFTPAGHLAEGCFCNVFLRTDDELLTPPLDTPVLDGIIRGVVMELCDKLAIKCSDDRPLGGRDLLDADEVFMTSSCSSIRPVVRVEDHVIADGKVGPITSELMKAYNEILESECRPEETT
ncbi:MAG: aminotransferase class IV [Phycisphaerae bacterium]|jgi:branched-chain amino acid aminotransferase|nr:aminotransferase class IV [Phycisphaerae bacterium]MDP7288839.1 aminotransferase class IV [Phycisphaerae bacterium]